MKLVATSVIAAIAAACSSVDPSPDQPLELSARVERNAAALDSAVVIMSVTNISGAKISVNLSPCVSGFAAFTSSDRKGTPAWSVAPARLNCTPATDTRIVLPASKVDIRISAQIPAELRGRRVYFTTTVTTLPPGGITVSAGDLEL